MTPTRDPFEARNACGPMSPQHVAVLRSRGMHAIRFQLVVRLLHAGMREDTLSIFWDHGAESLLEQPPGEARWRLVLGRGRRIAADFPDPWVVGYPDDAQSRQSVEAALDGMVETARRHGLGEPRPPLHPPAATKTDGPGPHMTQ